MLSLLFVGLIGGLVTGISPCILPVLPVIFFSGATGIDDAEQGGGKRKRNLRPYLVIAGMVLSFSTFTLIGSSLLSLFGLPQDTLRWAGIVALAILGLALMLPRLERLLEKPFTWIPQRSVKPNRGGFFLGLALGAVYVPCAGPVLAVIILAGSTGNIDLGTVVLTVSFAVGATLPLLFFALAGNRLIDRIKAFRARQRRIRVAAGVTMLLLAVALVTNLPQTLQRAIPDYTSALQDKVNNSDAVRNLDLGGLINDQNRQLSECSADATSLESCGTAPDIKGITAWLNTPDGSPIDLASLHGKVVLIDFWAYSCINCQRSIPHVVAWDGAYAQDGLQVIGIHTPEYAFEKVRSNVRAAADKLGITYPIALDDSFSTWTNYRNRYWPAHYLIDAEGVVRHIKFGEGGYETTEKLIRQLLKQANPEVTLPPATETIDNTPDNALITPETYLSAGKVRGYSGDVAYETGTHSFSLVKALPQDSFGLDGTWTIGYQGIKAGRDAQIGLHYRARSVYIVAGGSGTLSVTRAGVTTTVPIAGEPTLHQIVDSDSYGEGNLVVGVPAGLTVYSFTFG